MRFKVVERLSIDDRDVTSEYDTHEAAYLSARRFACASGAMRVRVYDPNGTLIHEWNKTDNLWIAGAR